ncbi:hypothetical protein PPTG_22220 [Phytophthora nicotianae INRA-310]|uniref:Uncharacterized protein n=1 Tax=Phytophthora nicotianae (strain INRA-310) TaxID=761204 RepID=W2QMA4_PHYN3|nr:hypothetical protein PPTG_22220 [Phytophthora nicotianae INRA-310]ETN14302.1 hypothetical protein PPTG_22220 [Phytophthora nicotianae INRA-310]
MKALSAAKTSIQRLADSSNGAVTWLVVQDFQVLASSYDVNSSGRR